MSGQRLTQRLGPITRDPLIWLLLSALALFLLAQQFAWLQAWPKGWVLPVTDLIDQGLRPVIAALKPTARALAALLGWPMAWAKALLTATPWPALVPPLLAYAWWAGGWRMALLMLLALSFILFSGYWLPGMNTLSLVAVSVPLALVLGFALGLLAHQWHLARRALLALLDFMQTVPTFAYLTPLLALFGFGPVVGLIASAIYAAPPMARNVLLALDLVEPEVREAARMAGASRWQRLFWVELPAGRQQLMVGVNQTVMAALSMVIIAAVIGGFEDIGWEVLLTMRKALFGQALVAGMVIVLFAIVIDRSTAQLASDPRRFHPRSCLALALLGGLAGWLLAPLLPDAAGLTWLRPLGPWLDQGLAGFVRSSGSLLDAIKNGALFYVFLPLRIGLDNAVLPFTWGFAWTQAYSLGYLLGLALLSGALAGLLSWRAGLLLWLSGAVLLIGITQIPWSIVLLAAGLLAHRAGGWRLTAFTLVSLVMILLAGLWERAMLSSYLCLAAVLACLLLGSAIGLASAFSPLLWRLVRPMCDSLQTIPLFVFLIPVLMLFQIGEFSAFLAIVAYAIVPMIRYSRFGIVQTDPTLIEAAQANGATAWQILWQVRWPCAIPSLLLGLNQTILYAFAMLVICALVGTTGLGQAIYIALGRADVGLGVGAGVAMALLAMIADRMVQGFAQQQKAALGL